MLLDEIVDKIWRENWDIIRVSKAYKEGYPLKLAKPMIEYLFRSAMFKFYEILKKEGDYVLVPLDVAETIVWSHVWRIKCNDCGEVADYDAVGFLHYLNNGKKCDACGSENTSWGLLLGDEEVDSDAS